jgi:hypothetical protein
MKFDLVNFVLMIEFCNHFLAIDCVMFIELHFFAY